MSWFDPMAAIAVAVVAAEHVVERVVTLIQHHKQKQIQGAVIGSLIADGTKAVQDGLQHVVQQMTPSIPSSVTKAASTATELPSMPVSVTPAKSTGTSAELSPLVHEVLVNAFLQMEAALEQVVDAKLKQIMG